jgi:predicted transcriptional regulator
MNRHIGIKLPEDLCNELDALAGVTELSQAGLARLAIRLGLPEIRRSYPGLAEKMREAEKPHGGS